MKPLKSLALIGRFSILFALLLFTASCKREGSLFSNPDPRDSGIEFTNALTPREGLSILDYLYFYNGGGVAIGDIDNDGLPDIFFSGNQVPNRLYRNLGNLKFEDISEQAGIGGNSSWNTGSTMADVNGDGLLDIYVCAVVGINGFKGHNELYINNGDGTFTESAREYGLDFDSYSSNAVFFDYDLDGDLDMYLLNHAVHTQNSFGKFDLRFERRYETGDKLLRNDNGSFVDVSEEAGIYGGINGYGLGLAVADFNLDGYPDIYVGNDFHEDDYYYLNNGDGTFTESLKTYFGHTSRFSMGNDVADINGDGRPDLLSLDMLPEDEVALKSSEGDDNVQTQKMRVEHFGYHYQFTRNMLFVNQEDGNFMETALLSGIAATDNSDFLVTVKETIAGCTGADPAPLESLLRLQPEVLRGGTCRDNQGIACIVAGALQPKRAAFQVHAVDMIENDLRVKTLGMLLHLDHQIRPLQVSGTAGPVFDLGCRGQLTTLLHTRYNDWVQIGPCGIHCRGISGRTGTQDN